MSDQSGEGYWDLIDEDKIHKVIEAAIRRGEARGRAEGVAAERARVVAWLRAADSETLVWFAAQRIEQGWHDKEPK